jgi:hypothetical protein
MVDSLIYYGIVKTREEGVELGRTLQDRFHLFDFVPHMQLGRTFEISSSFSFNDDYNFYRLNHERIQMILSSDCGCSDVVVQDAVNLVMAPNASNTIDFKEMADKFRALADVRHRRYRFRMYKEVFVGCELVDKLVHCGVTQNRAEAVQVGRQLQKEMSLFHHVCDEHLFADEWYFYRFTAKKSGRGRPMTLKEKMRSRRNV